MSYIKANLAEDSLLHKVYFALYMLMPFAILAISLWMEFSGGWGDERKLFMLGLSEFIFGVGNAGMGAGVYPWFCDFDIVGWIVTIVCFCYMFRLLMKQAGLLMGFVNRRSDGMLLKKVLYYVIYFAIAASVTMFSRPRHISGRRLSCWPPCGIIFTSSSTATAQPQHV